MKTFLIAVLTFLGVSMFAPQAEARSRHYRHYSGHHHYGRSYYHGHHRHYYPRYYSSSYYYYPRVRHYGYYNTGYCYPRYYRPGVSFVFRF